MRDYLDLIQGTEPVETDEYPKGDDATGKPKKSKQNLKAPFKNKIGKGGTKKTKEGTTTAGPDEMMRPEDMNKSHPGA